MCLAQDRQRSESTSNLTPIDEKELQQRQSLLNHLTDAHCHPTDDPAWSNIEAISEKLACSRLGSICAQSTNQRDQSLVAQLCDKNPEKVIPCFGYHPWFVHTISYSSTPVSKEDHYRSILLPSSLQSSKDLERESLSKTSLKALSDFDSLMKYLPDPIPIKSILSDIRSKFEKYPKAMLGEVGLDKVFKLPFGEKGWTREIEETSSQVKESETSSNPHTLALRHHELSSLTPSMSHQVKVLSLQLALAVQFKRNVSLHCVKASGALTQFLEDERAKYGSDWYGINIDLHSCSLSVEQIQQLFKKYPNLYASFSSTINLRSDSFKSQVRAIPTDRLMVESDWHSGDGLDEKILEITKIVGEIWKENGTLGEVDEEDLLEQTVHILAKNWRRFVKIAQEEDEDEDFSDVDDKSQQGKGIGFVE